MASGKGSPFVISSFKGGLNLYDPPTALPQDQVVEATNVEWNGSTLGDRRLGHSVVTLPAHIQALTGVYKMHRHLPTNDESASQLWILAATPGVTADFYYKVDATWNTMGLFLIVAADAPVITATALPKYQFQTLHGKLFFAYPSGADRLHLVVSGSSLRRASLSAPAAPSVSQNAAGSGYTGKRYFRIRFVEMSGTSILRRSEPSTSTTHTPDAGGGDGSATITKPAALNSEQETHWEVEASLDNSNFYMISRQSINTTTYSDTVLFATGYAASGTLSEAVGDYTPLPSAKFLLADDDRLLLFGSWSDVKLGSRVQWTPPSKDPGFGSDERLKLSTDPFLDLDGYEGGEITGARSMNGVIYVFKWSHLYRLSRTGQLSQAYEAFPVSKTIGAIPGSIVEGTDNQGNPALFFVDRIIGPCMLGRGGLIKLVRDIRPLWDTRDKTTSLEAIGVYHPLKHQVRWEFTVTGTSGTSCGMVLHLNEMRITEEGGTRGWAKWTGLTGIHDMILYADNVESGAARTTSLVPIVCISSVTGNHIMIADSGTTDAGTAYAAALTSRPLLFGGGTDNFGVRAAALIGTASSGVTVDLSASRDFGKETTKTVSNISLTPSGTETYVMPQQDNFFASESKSIQVRIADSSPATGTWHLHQLALIPRGEQSA